MNFEIAAAIVWSITVVFGLAFILILLLWLIDFLGTIHFLLVKPVQNQFLYAMRGDDCEEVIYSIDGWKLDEKKDVMIKGVTRKKKTLEKIFGVRWLGMPFIKKILRFGFSWDELGKKAGGVGHLIIPHANEMITSLFFEATYVLSLEGAETRGQIPLNMRIILSIRRLHPRRAAFKFGTPSAGFDTTTAMVLNAVRKLVRTMTVEQILGSADTTSGTEDKIIQSVYELNTRAELAKTGEEIETGTLADLTGYFITNVSIESITPILSDEELSTLRSVPLAKIQRDATIIAAEGRKQAQILDGQGKAGALEVQAKVMSSDSNARIIAIMDRVADTNLITLGELGKDSGVNVLVQQQNPKKKGENTEE